jgi:palmitoyltransferase ZDHHC9/14/18
MTEPSTFPNPANSANRPLSQVSRMTDEFSEDGGNFSTPVRGQVPQSAGEPDISRPGSAQTGVSSRGNWSHRGGEKSYAGSVGAGSTRPPTATSRTHVPSLTASAFYRPMSSQRLQAQRGQRPPSAMTQSTVPGQSVEDEDSPTRIRTGRSVQSLPQSRAQGQGQERPLSRGTDITEFPGGIPESDTVPSLPPGAAAHISRHEDNRRSRPGSEVPLNALSDKSNSKFAGGLDMDRLRSDNVAPEPKSPRTLATLISNRYSKSSLQLRQQGHEKLPSEISTPNFPDAAKETVRKELGKNHQYFQGNTVFCLGGRLQNARDRPINLITAFIIVLPIVLFGVFSAKWLWLHVSPAIPILLAYVFLICFSSFWHASVTDPGVCITLDYIAAWC